MLVKFNFKNKLKNKAYEHRTSYAGNMEQKRSENWDGNWVQSKKRFSVAFL